MMIRTLDWWLANVASLWLATLLSLGPHWSSQLPTLDWTGNKSRATVRGTWAKIDTPV